MIDQAQLQRIHLQRHRQLVHRRLDGEHAGVLARRAHVRGAGDVQLDDFVHRADVRRRVDGARRAREALVVLAHFVRLADPLVNECDEAAVGGRAEGHALLGLGTVAVGEEELFARQP